MNSYITYASGHVKHSALHIISQIDSFTFCLYAPEHLVFDYLFDLEFVVMVMM